MAFIYSGEEKPREYNDQGYRSYLITRSQAPMVHHSCEMQFKRLRVHARSAMNRIDGFLHRMIEALANAKMRRFQRERALRGARHRRSPNEGTARSPNELPARADRGDRSVR